MIRPVSLSIIFIHLVFVARAQTTSFPVYEITSDTAALINLPKTYWQIAEDKNSKETFVSISSAAQNKNFHSDSSNIKGIDYSVHTFWVRYTLKNGLGKELSILLMNTNTAARFDIYVRKTSDEVTHYITGYLYPYKKRDGIKEMNAIPVVLPPGVTMTIYCRLNFDYFVTKPQAFTMAVGVTEKLLVNAFNNTTDNNRINLLYHLADGIYLFGLILNFLFFIITREKVYLFLTIFLLYLFFSSPIWPVYVFANHLAAFKYLNKLIGPLGVITYIQYLRHFLKTAVTRPIWDRALNGICILLASFSVGTFFLHPVLSYNAYDVSSHIYYDIVNEIGLYMILITLLLYRNSKIKSISLLLLSGLPVVIFETLFLTLEIIANWLQEHRDIPPPHFIQWLSDHDVLINNALMSWLAIVFSWILFRRFLDLQKQTIQQAIDKERLEKKREIELKELAQQQKIVLEKTVEERTADLKTTLENLKATQSQLIQSEKMASLGQLTAGIAHEIQNPLNFVNNFSEVNNELIEELKHEMSDVHREARLPMDEEILTAIYNNNEKIMLHGKRADAIVKGMLLHSQKSTGEKQATDLNALADEYLKLAYHGMRAKEKDFNPLMNTLFDETIGRINIVAQDIGRVLLNLYTNAFYAIRDKQKKMDAGYLPTITVSTKKVGSAVEIKVTDNGTGIPPEISDKIFQPFFTTKPTGQGTGLGLSLAYDIVKAHGGEIKAETTGNAETIFTIRLPLLYP
ncbi:MAG: histidine kinase [Bacteroidetes bacterium]|nr:histidine kinase [Bacteroidota bacterium]